MYSRLSYFSEDLLKISRKCDEMNFIDDVECNHNTWSKWLVTGAIFGLIFDNIPKILQLSTISGGFSCKFSWYFLVILMILWIYHIYRGNFIIEKEDLLFIKYIFCLMFIVLLSNILGLVNYPYYNELLSGPSSQIEKLPAVLALLNSHGIHIDEKQLTMVWLGIRSIKGAILSTIYTFGFSFILYQFFKRDWSYYFDLITKVVIASIILLCIYSIIELFYLAGFDFAKYILSYVNPMIHPIAVDHGWWPPLLWERQLRSMFSEPSRMGNYLAFALPFLWGKFLLSDKKHIGLISLITFYTFMIFMTKARTAVAMYWGVLALLFLGILYIHRKDLFKRFFALCGITVLSLVLSIGFINVTTPNSNKSNDNNHDMTIASYMEDNVGSLGSANKRSNGARYALIRANIKTGIEYPILGAGDVLSSAYTVHNFNEADLANPEVHMWVTNYNKMGVLRYGFNAMNEYVSRFANNGIIGLIAYILPLIYIALRLFKCFMRSRGIEQIKIMIAGISLIGSAVAGCNGSLALLYAYWVILAFSYAIVNEIRKKNMSGLT